MKSRASERVVADREVTCRFGGRKSIVLMYDLSVDGCMIDATDLEVTAGDPILLDLLDERSTSGEVVWQKAGCAGIRFAEPLHPVLVQYLGFRQPAEPFQAKLPRDRFGRLLPGLTPPASREAVAQTGS